MSNLWVLPEELGDLADSEYAYEACKTASFLLYGLSGRKYDGVNTVTEVYQQPIYVPDRAQALQAQSSSQTLFSALLGGPATNTLRLKGRPVNRIETVRVGRNLDIMDEADYYLYDRATVRFRRPIDDFVEITYQYGTPPPVAGRMAARELAIQFAMYWGGDARCELPSRITTSVSREGMSYTILDQQDFIAELRTGVYAVDLFLKTVNPDRALRKSRVFSPDIPRGRRANSKPLLLPTSDMDIVVHADPGITTLTIPVSDVDAEFLTIESGWDLEVVLYSYNSKSTMTLVHNAELHGDNLYVTIEYPDAFKVLGRVDPGTWDLYAVKNGASVHITSGNLSVKLSKGEPYVPPTIVP